MSMEACQPFVRETQQIIIVVIGSCISFVVAGPFVRTCVN